MEKKKTLPLLFFFFLLFKPISGDEDCTLASCSTAGPQVRFPFRLRGRQPARCGFSGFDLSCNKKNQTLLKLPSVRSFIVKSISYASQVINIDPDFCSPVGITDVNLTGTPFAFSIIERYTFFNCSSQNSGFTFQTVPMLPFPCLGSLNHSVFAVRTAWIPLGDIPATCEDITTISVPTRRFVDFRRNELSLMWFSPFCRPCELDGRTCRLKSDGETVCFGFSSHACGSSCLNDCICNADTFISGVCQHLNDDDLNSISHLFVPKGLYSNTSQIHIKVPSTDLYSKKNKKVFLGAVVGSVAGVVFILGVILLIIHRKKMILVETTAMGAILLLIRTKKMLLVRKTTMEGSLVAFVYSDLRIATKNFSNKLGGGSFGSVFKGVLHDSSIVAVKKLESVSQGEKEFRSEVSTIGIIQHVNLVRLCGFCAQGKNRLLVYDYMPNGSLNSHFFHEKQDFFLAWETRYQIALGTARGLVYLHEKCRDRIIHCDIKPENILLDANFCPKIADFGMAKLIGRDFSRVLTTMRGTRGYLAPEWLSGLAVTTKADVFSYGMMLFELVSGKRNSHQLEDGSFAFFPSLAANVLMTGGDILSLLDSRLNREANVEQITKIFKVANWCIQHEEDSRPSMIEVERILEGILDISMPPIPEYVKYFADDVDDFLFFKQP